MSGSWQLVMVSLIVAGAAAYLVRRSWRSWRFPSQGCGGSCGCAATKPKENTVHFVPAEQLTLRFSEMNQEAHTEISRPEAQHFIVSSFFLIFFLTGLLRAL